MAWKLSGRIFLAQIALRQFHFHRTFSYSVVESIQAAINEGNGLHKISPALVAEKEEYVYRSYLALGQHHIILTEIKDNHPKTTVGKT